jgi:hypothetical protein
MKTDQIPILSYVFIGVTSLVLTYATIADTTDEIILPPPSASIEPEVSIEPDSQTSSLPAIALPSLAGTIEKLKTLNPFTNAATSSRQEEIPVAVPVEPSAPPLPINKYPSSGGKKSIKHRKKKQKKTRRSSK